MLINYSAEADVSEAMIWGLIEKRYQLGGGKEQGGKNVFKRESS
jgi:hypothetical protein